MTLPASLDVAFKEWAAICRVLERDRQCLILRKGGISEEGGSFRADRDDFLLYPTHFHEQRTGLKPEYNQAFDAAERDRAAAGTIDFSLVAHVTDVHYVTDLETALALDSLHAWTSDVIRQRFHYRTPGLYVLTVRIYRLPEVAVRLERPEYAGCKTWVHLETPVATAAAVPVLSDDDFTERVRVLQGMLQSRELIN